MTTKKPIKKVVKKSKAITIKKNNQILNGESFEVILKKDQEYRSYLKKYISTELISGKDYGTITIGGRNSAPCLFKPGAEKIINLLNLTCKFYKDDTTLSMIPEKVVEQSNGIIVFRCELVSRKNNSLLAEGRGCCTILEKKGNINSTIKIAQKRAKVDAVLSLGLSDAYTQDLDDMGDDSNYTEPQAPRENYNPPPVSKKPTRKEIEKLVLGFFKEIIKPSEKLIKAMKDIKTIDDKKLNLFGSKLRRMVLDQKEDKLFIKYTEEIKAIRNEKNLDDKYIEDMSVSLFAKNQIKDLSLNELKSLIEDLKAVN